MQVVLQWLSNDKTVQFDCLHSKHCNPDILQLSRMLQLNYTVSTITKSMQWLHVSVKTFKLSIGPKMKGSSVNTFMNKSTDYIIIMVKFSFQITLINEYKNTANY